HRKAVPVHRVRRSANLALPEVCGTPATVQGRCQRVYGTAEMGDSVLRSARMIELAALAAPGHTAIVTQECQGAVIGPNAGLAVLAKEARRVALPNITRLLPAARGAGVHIVHCLVQRRSDGLGSNHNAKIFSRGRGGGEINPGTPGTAV